MSPTPDRWTHVVVLAAAALRRPSNSWCDRSSGIASQHTRIRQQDFPLTICIQKATLLHVFELQKTDVCAKWLDELRDVRASARMHYGLGYRVYFVK